MVMKYSFKEEDIICYPDANRLIPKSFDKGGGMLRFVTGEDQSCRCGFTKIRKGESIRFYCWYEEVWFVMRGEGQTKTIIRPATEEEVWDIKPDDAMYFGKGTHIYVECRSDQPLIFMYFAVPASKKEGRWMAHMLPQDIEDIRVREEF